ncbi:MAG: acyltransferase [Actinomycetota bacterium]
MFGLFRTLLAVFVVVGHLYGPAHLGVFAVLGFYVLSGLLMTKVMSESYGHDRDGTSRFLLNRMLRIYPAYWFTIGLTLLVLWGAPAITRDFHPDLVLPTDLEAWARNLTLVLSPYSGPRLSPATWALTVELFYYVLIGLGLTKTPRRSVAFLAIGIAATIYLAITGDGWGSRYYPIPAAALPFAIGACLHHHRNEIRDILGRLQLTSLLTPMTLLALNFAGFGLLDRLRDDAGYGLSMTLGFYLNLVVMTVVVALLADGGIPGLDRRTDTVIGDYSYPIYLTHWLGAALAGYLVVDTPRHPHRIDTDGWLYTGLGLLITLGLSLVIIRVIDPRIDGLRARVRPKPRAAGERSDPRPAATN